MFQASLGAPRGYYTRTIHDQYKPLGADTDPVLVSQGRGLRHVFVAYFSVQFTPLGQLKQRRKLTQHTHSCSGLSHSVLQIRVTFQNRAIGIQARPLRLLLALGQPKARVLAVEGLARMLPAARATLCHRRAWCLGRPGRCCAGPLCTRRSTTRSFCCRRRSAVQLSS